jgi:CHAD domain-containing protein
MAYRFLSAQSPITGELHRIFSEELDSAGGHLASALGDERDRHVHEARKNLKKVRALLRLLSPKLSSSQFRKLNRRIRDVGRQLSPLRDSEAMLESLRSLPEDLLPEPIAAAVSQILNDAKARVLASTDPKAALLAAASDLQVLRLHLDKAGLGEIAYDDLLRGLKWFYRRGRRAGKAARRTPTPEALHDFRKRVKDHWYHLRLLSDTAAIPTTRTDSFRQLETLLGDAHNLHLLGRLLRGGRDRQELVDGRALINAHQRHLEARALDLGAELYTERPRKILEALASVETSAIR